MTRIWFNHWFRTAYSLIELMKQNNDDKLYIIGSNRTAESPIMLQCDEWYHEEKIPEEEYVSFCLDFCREHNVDIFVPYLNIAPIAAAREEFDRIGVKLMCEPIDTINMLEDKASAYEQFSGKGINIPEYRIINNIAELETAYSELGEQFLKLCIKCVSDKGGQSFRVITQKQDEYESLLWYPTPKVSYDELHRILSNKGTFKSIMMMPFMAQHDVEVSVDCFDAGCERIMIPRFKYSGHVEKIIYDDEIMTMTNKVMDIIKPEYICDVQFRYLNDTPYLLEVNARMSGGLPLSCAASGVNIPSLALKKAMGIKITPEDLSGFTKETKTISFVEVPTKPH